MSECTSSEVVEVHYRGMKIEYPGEEELESLTLVASTINEKAQWMTDYSQVGLQACMHGYLRYASVSTQIAILTVHA